MAKTPLILLTDNTVVAEPVVSGKTLMVCHKAYAPPLLCGAPVIDFAEFKPRCRELVRGLDSLILVGLNRAMTPGNRTEDVWELLFNQTKWLHKVSIDNTLFVSDPWRSWFHFGFVGASYRDYTYSYIAESHYKKFVDGLCEDDPFSLEEMLRWSKGVVACDYRQWFEVEVETILLSSATHAEYAELKRAAFEEESSANRIVERLATYAASSCPRRRVPAPHQLFRSRRHQIVATDLPVDRWLLSHLQHLAELVNGLARESASWL